MIALYWQNNFDIDPVLLEWILYIQKCKSFYIKVFRQILKSHSWLDFKTNQSVNGFSIEGY